MSKLIGTEILVAVVLLVEEGSYPSVANKLGSTVASIKAQVSSLETELGLELFVRDSEKCELTSSGQVFIRAARAFLKEIELIGHPTHSKQI